MTKKEQILKRALEMAAQQLAHYCTACPLRNKKERRCGSLHTGYCYKPIQGHFTRKAKEAICKGN